MPCQLVCCRHGFNQVVYCFNVFSLRNCKFYDFFAVVFHLCGCEEELFRIFMAKNTSVDNLVK